MLILRWIHKSDFFKYERADLKCGMSTLKLVYYKIYGGQS